MTAHQGHGGGRLSRSRREASTGEHSVNAFRLGLQMEKKGKQSMLVPLRGKEEHNATAS